MERRERVIEGVCKEGAIKRGGGERKLKRKEDRGRRGERKKERKKGEEKGKEG